jgi:hypothetical protein
MQHSPDYCSFNSLPSTENGIQRPVRAANIAYQYITIAAMILLLGSLWVF